MPTLDDFFTLRFFFFLSDASLLLHVSAANGFGSKRKMNEGHGKNRRKKKRIEGYMAHLSRKGLVGERAAHVCVWGQEFSLPFTRD